MCFRHSSLSDVIRFRSTICKAISCLAEGAVVRSESMCSLCALDRHLILQLIELRMLRARRSGFACERSSEVLERGSKTG